MLNIIPIDVYEPKCYVSCFAFIRNDRNSFSSITAAIRRFEGSADVIVTGYKNHPIDYFRFNREPNKRNMNSIEFPSFPYKFRTRQCFGYEIVFRRKCE